MKDKDPSLFPYFLAGTTDDLTMQMSQAIVNHIIKLDIESLMTNGSTRGKF